MVIIRHALKNALVPVVTYAGPLLATLLTGSFVVETLFSVPGIGAEFVTSVSNRDYTMIMALTIFYGAFIIICNIVTDLITALMDENPLEVSLQKGELNYLWKNILSGY